MRSGAPLIRDRSTLGVWNGPGSAARHHKRVYARLRRAMEVLRCARDTLDTDGFVGDHSRKPRSRRHSMKTGLAILVASLMALSAHAQTEAPAKLVGYITLPNVEG